MTNIFCLLVIDFCLCIDGKNTFTICSLSAFSSGFKDIGFKLYFLINNSMVNVLPIPFDPDNSAHTSLVFVFNGYQFSNQF